MSRLWIASEEDVNYVNCADIQNKRYGNQSGNRNFNGSGQKSITTRAHSTENPFVET